MAQLGQTLAKDKSEHYCGPFSNGLTLTRLSVAVNWFNQGVQPQQLYEQLKGQRIKMITANEERTLGEIIIGARSGIYLMRDGERL